MPQDPQSGHELVVREPSHREPAISHRSKPSTPTPPQGKGHNSSGEVFLQRTAATVCSLTSEPQHLQKTLDAGVHLLNPVLVGRQRWEDP